MTNVALSDFVGYRRPPVSMSILIVDDDQPTRELCTTVAAQSGLNAVAVPSAEHALNVLEQRAIDILLTDLKLPGLSGIELIKRVSELYPGISTIVLTQYGTIDSA